MTDKKPKIKIIGSIRLKSSAKIVNLHSDLTNLLLFYIHHRDLKQLLRTCKYFSKYTTRYNFWAAKCHQDCQISKSLFLEDQKSNPVKRYSKLYCLSKSNNKKYIERFINSHENLMNHVAVERYSRLNHSYHEYSPIYEDFDKALERCDIPRIDFYFLKSVWNYSDEAKKFLTEMLEGRNIHDFITIYADCGLSNFSGSSKGKSVEDRRKFFRYIIFNFPKEFATSSLIRCFFYVASVDFEDVEIVKFLIDTYPDDEDYDLRHVLDNDAVEIFKLLHRKDEYYQETFELIVEANAIKCLQYYYRLYKDNIDISYFIKRNASEMTHYLRTNARKLDDSDENNNEYNDENEEQDNNRAKEDKRQKIVKYLTFSQIKNI